MVVHELSDPALDRLFQALADATRRDIMRRVSAAPASISTLSALYAMSFAAVHKHVTVLERAALITKERHGREQLVHANPQGLADVRQVLTGYEAIWLRRTQQIATLLEETER